MALVVVTLTQQHTRFQPQSTPAGESFASATRRNSFRASRTEIATLHPCGLSNLTRYLPQYSGSPKTPSTTILRLSEQIPLCIFYFRFYSIKAMLDFHESCFPIVTDPSTTDMPPWVKGAYTEMNKHIAEDESRYGDNIQRPHLTLSRRAISATAHAALHRAPRGEERSALILGAGGCFDIPLEEIVTDFDKTTLVDVDVESTERALSDLPTTLLGKVSILKSDITGNVAGLSKIIENARKLPYLDFIDAATSDIKEQATMRRPLNLQGKYSFTCSQLLMTQLSSIPFIRFASFVGEQYGKPLSMGLGLPDEPLIRALNEYNLGVQVEHIDHLAQLALSHGSVHFADTVAEVRNGQILPMISTAPLQRLDRHFDRLKNDEDWLWQSLPTRAFYVFSHSLIPKST